MHYLFCMREFELCFSHWQTHVSRWRNFWKGQCPPPCERPLNTVSGAMPEVRCKSENLDVDLVVQVWEEVSRLLPLPSLGSCMVLCTWPVGGGGSLLPLGNFWCPIISLGFLMNTWLISILSKSPFNVKYSLVVRFPWWRTLRSLLNPNKAAPLVYSVCFGTYLKVNMFVIVT